MVIRWAMEIEIINLSNKSTDDIFIQIYYSINIVKSRSLIVKFVDGCRCEPKII